VPQGEGRPSKTVKDWHEGCQRFYDIKLPVYSWPGVMIPPGQFAFPFSFMLPATLPGTFHEDCPAYSASISYVLEAELTSLGLSGTHMESSQIVVLREMLKEGVAPKQGEMTAEV